MQTRAIRSQREVRSNLDEELIIRYGVWIDRTFGALCAWKLMAENGISIAVILRVLTDTNHRRDSDPLIADIVDECMAGNARSTQMQTVGSYDPYMTSAYRAPLFRYPLQKTRKVSYVTRECVRIFTAFLITPREQARFLAALYVSYADALYRSRRSGNIPATN